MGFEDYMVKQMQELTTSVQNMSTQIAELKTYVAEDYVPQTRCNTQVADDKDTHKMLMGWIIGAYVFMLSVVGYFIKR